jgi:hypothetical protein
VLERTAPQRPAADAPADDVDDATGPDPEPTPSGKGRGASARKTPPARAAKKIKGRTVYLPDDLFERILVQAHRRDKTISEYITSILERQVPDHRTVRGADDAA